MLMSKENTDFKNAVQFIIPTESFADYAQHPMIRRVYLTDVGFYPHAQGHYKERPDGTDACILLYCLDGKGTIRTGGNEYVLSASEAFCIPRGMPHCYFADEKDPWSILWVHFKGDDVARYPIDRMEIERMNSPSSDRRMQSYFEILFHVLEKDFTLGNFIYISQMLSLILSEIYFRERTEENTPQNRHVTSVIRYMYAHIDQSLTLEELSEQVGLSKSYLNTIFRASTGHSPVDFFLRLKMEEACKLLQMENGYVYEVAAAVGYSDPYYFSRLFRKIIGVSPKEYRQRLTRMTQ